MKNLKYKADNGRGVVLPLAVPAGNVAGNVVAIGTAGLYGICETDAVTDQLRLLGKAPQGLRNGQASVVLPQVGSVYDLGPLPPGMNDGDKVFVDPTTQTLAAAQAGANVWVGWKLGAYVGFTSN